MDYTRGILLFVFLIVSVNSRTYSVEYSGADLNSSQNTFHSVMNHQIPYVPPRRLKRSIHNGLSGLSNLGDVLEMAIDQIVEGAQKLAAQQTQQAAELSALAAAQQATAQQPVHQAAPAEVPVEVAAQFAGSHQAVEMPTHAFAQQVTAQLAFRQAADEHVQVAVAQQPADAHLAASHQVVEIPTQAPVQQVTAQQVFHQAADEHVQGVAAQPSVPIRKAMYLTATHQSAEIPVQAVAQQVAAQQAEIPVKTDTKQAVAQQPETVRRENIKGNLETSVNKGTHVAEDITHFNEGTADHNLTSDEAATIKQAMVNQSIDLTAKMVAAVNNVANYAKGLVSSSVMRNSTPE